VDDLLHNTLFEPSLAEPLAARLRPQSLDEYVGQPHLLGDGMSFRAALETDQLHSMILWGPPGVGKTTLARLIAQQTSACFVQLSAVMAGVKDIKAAVERARIMAAQQQRTLLFIDEVHRFNKAQQDAFLPYVEDGTLVFIGATTENPSFELNRALLSRAVVYPLRLLSNAELTQIARQALANTAKGLGSTGVELSPQALERLANFADGDARRLLNGLESVVRQAQLKQYSVVDERFLSEVLKHQGAAFDKGGDQFYELISALHKSVRGSSVDGALYWFSRMLEGGCDPLYIARRVVRMASEDIGNADPRALNLALNAWDVQERLGSPEGELAIAQAVVYLAAAPKSNAVYLAYKRAKQLVKTHPSYEVPLHLRNAPTALMHSLDYGAEYRYAHDEPDAYAAGECYLPEPLQYESVYQPVPRGLEAKISVKLSSLKAKDQLSVQQRYAQPSGCGSSQKPAK
jgi:putative ATPase